MRSRYTAFVRERADYLLATWHPSHRPASLDFDAAAQWLGLEVRGHWVKDADHAEVEFVARHRLGGRAVRLHERSRFVREGGRWYYVDGDMPPRALIWLLLSSPFLMKLASSACWISATSYEI